ncbi:MAG: redoxin domain-containing protein [Bacteroidales bacterium]|nr:redoxin domain-containing protein [Bacteroidales bacterium]
MGSRAPDFNLRNEQNKLVSLKEFSGDWSLLCFYNNKCLNRTDSLIYNVPKATSMLGDSLRTVFIYTEPEPENDNLVLPYPTVNVHLQAKGFWAESIIKKYGVEMYPYFVLIDPEGIIRYSKATDISGAIMFFNNK